MTSALYSAACFYERKEGMAASALPEDAVNLKAHEIESLNCGAYFGHDSGMCHGSE